MVVAFAGAKAGASGKSAQREVATRHRMHSRAIFERREAFCFMRKEYTIWSGLSRGKFGDAKFAQRFDAQFRETRFASTSRHSIRRGDASSPVKIIGGSAFELRQTGCHSRCVLRFAMPHFVRRLIVFYYIADLSSGSRFALLGFLEKRRTAGCRPYVGVKS